MSDAYDYFRAHAVAALEKARSLPFGKLKRKQRTVARIYHLLAFSVSGVTRCPLAGREWESLPLPGGSGAVLSAATFPTTGAYTIHKDVNISRTHGGRPARNALPLSAFCCYLVPPGPFNLKRNSRNVPKGVRNIDR